FCLTVPVAASAALLAPRLIPAPTRGRAVFDLSGAATATVGLGLLVFGLSGAADHGWTTALTLGPILAGLLALATFVGLEARSKQPLMPLWVFRDRNRGGAYLIQALLGAALFGMFFLSTLFLQHVLGYSPLKAGAAFIPLTVVMIASAGLVSKLVVHTGDRPRHPSHSRRNNHSSPGPRHTNAPSPHRRLRPRVRSLRHHHCPRRPDRLDPAAAATDRGKRTGRRPVTRRRSPTRNRRPGGGAVRATADGPGHCDQRERAHPRRPGRRARNATAPNHVNQQGTADRATTTLRPPNTRVAMSHNRTNATARRGTDPTIAYARQSE